MFKVLLQSVCSQSSNRGRCKTGKQLYPIEHLCYITSLCCSEWPERIFSYVSVCAGFLETAWSIDHHYMWDYV